MERILNYIIKEKEDITDYILTQTIKLNPSKKYIYQKLYIGQKLHFQ